MLAGIPHSPESVHVYQMASVFSHDCLHFFVPSQMSPSLESLRCRPRCVPSAELVEVDPVAVESLRSILWALEQSGSLGVSAWWGYRRFC
jgi:hypothetical protein